MMRTLIITLALATLFCCASNASAQQGGRTVRRGDPVVVGPPQVETDKSGRDADVRRLLEILSPPSEVNDLIGVMMERLKKSLPPIPESAWLDVKQMVEKEFTYENMMKAVIPIYARHFTAKEVKQLIVFYQSPLGRKLAHELPKAEQESRESGFIFGVELRKRILEMLRSKGYSVPLA